MNCDRYQQMMPAFLDGDLPPGDADAINTHAASCEACREALAEFRRLEDVLALRRDEVPSHERFVQGVFAAGAAPVPGAVRAVSPAFHRARVIMDAIFSVPGLAAVFSVIIGAMCFHYRAVISAWMGIATSATPPTTGATNLLNQALTANPLDMTQMFVVYGVVTALIVLSGAWMTLRFVQDQ